MPKEYLVLITRKDDKWIADIERIGVYKEFDHATQIAPAVQKILDTPRVQAFDHLPVFNPYVQITYAGLFAKELNSNHV